MKGYLHSNYGIYEEKHSDEKTDIRKRLLEKRQQGRLFKTHHKGKNLENNINIFVRGIKMTRQRKLTVKFSNLERLHKGP